MVVFIRSSACSKNAATLIITRFLALTCIPFPLIIYHYSATLVMKCKFAFEAAKLMKKMQIQQVASSNMKERVKSSD
jgi:hypothetical protein